MTRSLALALFAVALGLVGCADGGPDEVVVGVDPGAPATQLGPPAATQLGSPAATQLGPPAATQLGPPATVVANAASPDAADDERLLLEKKRDRFRVRAYRGVRTVALKGVFGGLALAARKADGIEMGSLPAPVRDAAALGADLVRQHAGEGLDPAQVDWGAIADRLGELGAHPPARVSMTVATALAMTGQSSLALEELLLLDPERLTTNEERVAYDALAGVLYRMGGYSTLADRHLQAAARPEEGKGIELTPKMQAGLHGLIAMNSLMNLDLATLDVEMTYMARAWPDNPITVFLTGERQAATGEPEKAATSLETWAASVGDEWLAKRVAERVRELRDGTGRRGLLVEDPEFVARLVRHQVEQAADESEMARELADLLGTAGELGGRLVDKLPGARRGSDR